MAYCTIKDVEDLTGLKFTQNSRPSVEGVEGFITDVAADLDGVAQAAGYDVPVTNEQAVATLKRYNTYGAGVAAWHAGFQSNDAPASVEYWNEQYNAFIGRLRRGEQSLPGVSTEEGAADPAFGIAPAVGREGYWLTGETL